MSKRNIFSNRGFEPQFNAEQSCWQQSQPQENPQIAALTRPKVPPSLLLPRVLLWPPEAALLSAGLEPYWNRARRKRCFHPSLLLSNRQTLAGVPWAPVFLEFSVRTQGAGGSI